MKCWIIYNGFLQSNKFLDYAEMLKDAAQSIGHQAMIFKNNELPYQLTSSNQSLLLRTEYPDYVLFTDKDIYLARQLELLGIPVFNSSDAIAISDDKILTYQQLANHSLPIPKTIVIPKTFGIKAKLDEQWIDNMMEQIGLPLVVKEAFGSFGEQVYLIEDRQTLMETISAHMDKPLMVQTFIQTSYGKDLRLQVVGDEVISSMKRQSKNDFRANITSGGKMSPYEPTKLEKEVAIQASKAIGATFAGVDLLFGENSTPIICEVNSNAHIRNLLDASGVNAAPYIIKEITRRLGGSY